MNFSYFFMLGFLIISANAFTTSNEIKTSRSFEGINEATTILSTAILQNENVDSDSNVLFSPFGFATLLALLREGSDGPTGEEISRVLHMNSYSNLRDEYQEVLTEFLNQNPHKGPQFKTWFYYYENNTIKQSYRNILEKTYQVEVKEVERFDHDFSADDEIQEENENTPTLELDDDFRTDDKATNGKDVIEFEDLKNSNPNEKTGEVEGFDRLKGHNLNNIDSARKFSFFSKKVLNKSKREVKPVRDEVASVLSGNTLMGKKENSKTNEDSNSTNKTEEKESKMLMFNGLYYRGNWGFKFNEIEDSTFFTTTTGKQNAVKMMYAENSFKYGIFEEYKFEAVLLPYDNKNYNLLILNPTSSEYDASFFNKFDAEVLKSVMSQMDYFTTRVTLPIFEIDLICQADKVLKKMGVNKLFTTDADLKLITEEQNIYIDELVQHVVFRIDAESGSHNSLTANNVISRSNVSAIKKVTADRPFLFFLIDVERDIILIGGKASDISTDREHY